MLRDFDYLLIILNHSSMICASFETEYVFSTYLIAPLLNARSILNKTKRNAYRRNDQCSERLLPNYSSL